MRRFRAGSLGLIAVFLISCSPFSRQITIEPQQGDSEATVRSLMSDLKAQNSHLKTFKGIGRIRIWNGDGGTQVARVAWVGADPGKLRIEARIIAGQLLAKFASDGEWLYFISPPGNQVVKTRSTNASLEHLISVPITIDDILALLAGRTPLIAYTSIRGTEGNVLLLSKGWWGGSEKIYLDDDRATVRKVEIFDGAGRLKYRALMKKSQQLKGYMVPRRLSVTNDEGAGFQLDIEKFWVDPVVPPAVFTLKAVEQGRGRYQ